MTSVSPRQPGETLFGFLMLAFSLFLFWQAYEISGFTALSAPGTYPMAVAAIMVISSCVSILHDRQRPAEQFSWHAFFQQILPAAVAILIGLIFVFAIMLETVGFLITAFLFLVISIQVLHRGAIGQNLLISAAALVAVYLVFRVIFVVVLPEGLIPESDIIYNLKQLFA